MAHVGREGRLGSSKAPGRTLQLVQCPACLESGPSAEMQLLGEEIRQATSLCLCSLEQGWALFWLPVLLLASRGDRHGCPSWVVIVLEEWLRLCVCFPDEGESIPKVSGQGVNIHRHMCMHVPSANA